MSARKVQTLEDALSQPILWDSSVRYVSLRLENDPPTDETLEGHPLRGAILYYNTHSSNSTRLLPLSQLGLACYMGSNLYDASAGCTGYRDNVVVLHFDLSRNGRIVELYDGNRKCLESYGYHH